MKTPQQEARELCERALPYMKADKVKEYVVNYLMGADQMSPGRFIGKHHKNWLSHTLSGQVLHVLYTLENTESITAMGSLRRALYNAYVTLRVAEQNQNHGIQEAPNH